MNQFNRVNFATTISHECMTNPEMLTNFICIVTEELSLIDLARIHSAFIASKKTVHEKKNLLN